MLNNIQPRNLFLALVVCSMVAGPSAAQDQPQLKVPNFEGWDNKDLYEYGASLLRKGRTLNRAIVALETLVKRDPGNSKNHLALGCAYASRYASISLARQQLQRYPDELRAFESNKERWETAQVDESSPYYRKPGPSLPLLPATPDDDVKFTMPEAVSRKRLANLGHLAAKSFSSSCKLSESEDMESRVSSLYAKGWGLFLLRRFGKDIVLDKAIAATHESKEDPLDAPLVVTEEEVAACFRLCTNQDSDKGDCWHSLALATVPKYLNFDIDTIVPYRDGEPLYDPAVISAAVSALANALKRKPSDFGLLYLMSLLHAPTDLSESVHFLERAVKADDSNAVAWYQLAERNCRLMERTMGKESDAYGERALQAVESGNSSPKYSAIPISLPVPTLLRKAWDSACIQGIGDEFLIIQIFSHLREYIRGEKATDPHLAARAAYAEFRFGLKIMQGMMGEDLDQRNVRMRTTLKLRKLFGPAYCVDGYQALAKLNQQRPDPEMTRFLQDNAPLINRVREMDRSAFH